MTEVQDTRVPRKRLILTVLAVIAAICWTLLVGTACVLMAFVTGFSAGGFTAGQAEMARKYNVMAFGILVGGLALALAPWIVGGILLGVRRWRSRASEGPEATEQDAG